MRISEFLRASCVGALLFSPAMADDIEKMHEEALRMLREKLGQANNDLPAPAVPNTAIIQAPALTGDAEMVRQRAEREARIKAEAQERIAERERLQADRRQQYEQWLKERERLRQQQRDYDLNAAQQMGRIKVETPEDEMHAIALKMLHHIEAVSATTPSVQVASASAALPVPRTDTPARSVSTVAPVTTTGAVPVKSSGSMMLAQADVDQIHAQALEALHQQQNQAAKPAVTSTPPTNNSGPQPSPELQRRLKQMELELEQEQREKQAASKGKVGVSSNANVPNAPSPATTTSVAPASTTISDAYIKDLEERARQQQGSVSNPQVGISSGGTGVGNGSPGLDPATRDILRRQDQEIARKMGSNSASFPRTAAPAGQTLTADQDAQAREALHQQQSNTAANVSATPASNISVPPPKTAKTATPSPSSTTVHRVESDNSNAQYSRELEERARQILAERAQNQPNATVQAPAGPNTVIVPSAPPQSSVSPTPAPQPTPAPSAPTAPTVANRGVPTAPAAGLPEPSTDVHARALDVLNQIEAGTAPKTKQQRIKELTDLYRADKMSPAEYHQKRAQILAEPQ
jgi:hypothetical protein